MRKDTGKTISYFLKEIWKNKPVYFVFFTLSILLMSVRPFLNIVFPKWIIEEMLGDRRVDMLAAYVVLLIVGNWITGTLIQVFYMQNYKLDIWFESYFERELTRQCITMDFEYTENPKVLDQVAKARDGMGFYSGGLRGMCDCLKKILSSVITLCGVVVIIAKTSPFLFLITLLAVGSGTIVISKMNQLEIAVFNKGPKINRAFWYIHDILVDAKYGKDIRLYHAEKVMRRKGEESFRDLYLLFKEQEDGKRKWGCFNAGITMLESLGTYLYLGYLAVKKVISIGNFTMLITAATTFHTGLMDVITQIQELGKKADFMKEYCKFMNYASAKEKGSGKLPELVQPEICFENVSFRYPGTSKEVLKDINITIHPGEHLSVVGLNGAGKTTFIKLLCRLYDVTEGSILINGVNIKEYEDEEYRKLLAVVFQDFKLFSMSIGENIRTGNWSKGKAAEDEELLELCEVCGLRDKIRSLPEGLHTLLYKYYDEKGMEPSGGEAQKMAIARALFKDAPIVVLDEPTAALDPVAEYEVYRHFHDLVGGKTAVYISHRLSSCKFCDRIAVFDEHTIKEYGTHEELLQRENGIYATMFRAQAQYYVDA